MAFVLFWFFFGSMFFSLVGLHMAEFSDQRYAVYLDSGHVFYGKIKAVGIFTLTLSDVYSFQTLEVGETSTSNLQAQRLNPLTAPDNWLVIERDHVLFFERIGKDARILELIRAGQ